MYADDLSMTCENLFEARMPGPHPPKARIQLRGPAEIGELPDYIPKNEIYKGQSSFE